DRLLAQLHDKVAGIVALVGTQGARLRPVGVRLDQRQCGQALGIARSAGRHRTDDQPVAVLHQRVAHETQTRFFAWSFAEEPGVGVGGRGVRGVWRRSPWKSCAPLRPGPGGSPEPSFGRKLFGLAQASSSVPSTEKCSLDNKRLTLSCESTAMRNLAATSPANNRSRFLVKVVASHTVSSMPSPTNQRNNRS